MSTILFLLLLIMESSGSTLHEEEVFERVPISGKNCSERYSCAQSESTVSSEEGLANINCYCDDLCQTYDDCCEDFKPKNDSKIETIHLPIALIACHNLGLQVANFVDHLSVYVVNRCPLGYNHSEIGKLCHRGSLNTSELIYRLPVNGNKTKILYRNYFCALCNNDTDLIFWTAKLQLDEDPATLLLNSSSKVPMNLDDLKFSYPDGIVPRICKSVIRRCSEDWVDHRVAKKCQNRAELNAYVYDESGTTHPLKRRAFRNMDCATCNFVETATVGCGRTTFRNERLQSSLRRIFFNFSLIFDLNSNHLIVTGPGMEKMTRIFPICPNGEIYDFFNAKCLRF